MVFLCIINIVPAILIVGYDYFNVERCGSTMTQAPVNQSEPKANQEVEKEEFTGTFIAVLILGLFLVVSWIGVWILFLIR